MSRRKKSRLQRLLELPSKLRRKRSRVQRVIDPITKRFRR